MSHAISRLVRLSSWSTGRDVGNEFRVVVIVADVNVVVTMLSLCVGGGMIVMVNR